MRVAPRAASAWPSEAPAQVRQRGDALLPANVVLGRIVRAVDFERVLKTVTQSRSPHFAVHHLGSTPSRSSKAPIAATGTDIELSTATDTRVATAVDDPAAIGVWLGMVVPKRHAKRSVTRTLLKRHIKAAMLRQLGQFGTASPAAGLWVVRLRAPFDRASFPSAASAALAEAAAAELGRVLDAAMLRLRSA